MIPVHYPTHHDPFPSIFRTFTICHHFKSCFWGNAIIFLLMERNKKKLQWTEQVTSRHMQETELLASLYPLYDSKKWKKIGKTFKEKGYQRTQIEIREKWINFVDPELNKTEWEEWQLQKMYDIHDQVGTKWCVIQKFIGRTQNMIKNRFYGTLRNYIRFLVNLLGGGDESYNQRISKLSPKFLNDIYKAQNQFRFLGQEIKDTIYAMRFKLDKKMLVQQIYNRRSLYERLKNTIMKIFKQIEMKAQQKRLAKRQRVKQEENAEEKDKEQKFKKVEKGEEMEKIEEEESEYRYSKRQEDEENEKSQERIQRCAEKGTEAMDIKPSQHYYPFLYFDPMEGFGNFSTFKIEQ